MNNNNEFVSCLGRYEPPSPVKLMNSVIKPIRRPTTMTMTSPYLIGWEGRAVGHSHQNPLKGVAILGVEQRNQALGLVGSQDPEK